MNKRGQRISFGKQDNVVVVLYDFAYALETRNHDITSKSTNGNKVTVNGTAIEEALSDIMSIFGYQVASIQ